MSDNESSELIGRTIAGKFVVESVIGTGGSGTVYRAVQPALDRTVALKVLRQDVAGDPRFVERFKREARAASRLNHPSSVGVLDFGWHEDSLLYLAMEYVEGRTLYDVILQEGPLAETRAAEILSQILSAVAVAHDLGVVHRDLKPDNIMIVLAKDDDGETTHELAKVCDFGIASLGAVVREGGDSEMAGPSITSHGLLIGTPAYMSPEQARGDPAEKRSDLYSAGVVLYHMLAGRVPFDGDNAATVVLKQINDQPVPLSTYAPVNPALEAVCMKALRKEPADRFATAREMRAALRGAVGHDPPAVEHPRGPVGHPLRGRWRGALTVGAAVLAAGLLFGLSTTKESRRDRRQVVAAPAAASDHEQPRAHEQPKRPLVPAPLATAVLPVTPETAPPPAPPPGPRRTRRSGSDRRAGATQPAAHASHPVLPADGVSPPPEPAAAPPAEAPAPTPPPAPAAAGAATPGRPAQPAPKAPDRVGDRSFDLNRARVSIVSITTSSGIPASNVRAAVARIAVLGCYRDALRVRGGKAEGTATLRLKIDVAGYVNGATVGGVSFLPALGQCLEQAARRARVRDVDTGDGTADVTFSFTMTP
jgi:eukaryotic-like serine/threonine-protein kinase